MKTSERGLAEIASHEGIVMSKYKDSVGVWTIGIGHTKNAGAPDPEKLKDALRLIKSCRFLHQISKNLRPEF
ncbi:MAG: hypothetical protein ABJN11_14115 [Lentilitoribacter sp.]